MPITLRAKPLIYQRLTKTVQYLQKEGGGARARINPDGVLAPIARALTHSPLAEVVGWATKAIASAA